jgi:hypothetical protein
VGCLDTCRSTSGYLVFLGDNLVSRSSKCQNVVSCLSAEVEYRAWPTAWRRRVGFVSFFRSCTISIVGHPSRLQHQRGLPPHQPYLACTPNLLRLISASSTSVSPLEMFVSSTSRRPPSLPTSLPRGSPPLCSQSFHPVNICCG